MSESNFSRIESFFEAIAGWRAAYGSARLHYLGVRIADEVVIARARLYLGLGTWSESKGTFRAQQIEAGTCLISTSAPELEGTLLSLASAEGLVVPNVGRLKLPSDDHHGIFVAPPSLLHPEGISSGNRLAVLTVQGKNWSDLLHQPATDWVLRGADQPYDSVDELALEYSLGLLRGHASTIEVVAGTAVEVLASSEVVGNKAAVGLWLAKGLDRLKAKLGYRVMSGGKVLNRGVVDSAELIWESGPVADSGLASISVPEGSIVQCIASYAGFAHQVQWRADKSKFQNPRAAALALADQRFGFLRQALLPDLPPQGRAQDDFEGAVAWALWALGFSPASFGTSPKTRDAFDIVAVTPNGDFAVIECTLGLLRAESKLSKLGARAAALRDSLASSNMGDTRVLSVMITAMPREQVKADLAQASSLGVLVLTRENLEMSLEELLRYPNPDALFERGWQEAVASPKGLTTRAI